MKTNCIIWSCDDNEHETSDDYTIQKPTQIPYFTNNNIKLKKICCGAKHVLAIDENDKLYTWGKNILNDTSNSRTLPRLVPNFLFKKIKNIKCGTSHAYIETKNNLHYFIGDNWYNQCLTNNNEPVNKLIKSTVSNKTIKSIHLGQDCTFFIFE